MSGTLNLRDFVKKTSFPGKKIASVICITIMFGAFQTAWAQQSQTGQQGQSSGPNTHSSEGVNSNGAAGSTASGTATGTRTRENTQNNFGGNFPGTPPPSGDDEEPTIATPMEVLNTDAQGRPMLVSTRCAEYSVNANTMANRMTGNNLRNLMTAQRFLAGDVESEQAKPAYNILASFQEELEKVTPDPTLAGTYLGLVTHRPLTQEIVARLNAIMCVTTSRKMVEAITLEAEKQRKAGME